jgi:hypothetical protein
METHFQDFHSYPIHRKTFETLTDLKGLKLGEGLAPYSSLILISLNITPCPSLCNPM